MKTFLFFATVYGLSASLAVLGFGSWWRLAGTYLDRLLFPSLWKESIPESERGGAIRIFVHCPACIAFWAGALASIILGGPSLEYFPHLPPIARVVVDGLASTGIIWCAHVTMTKLGQYGQ